MSRIRGFDSRIEILVRTELDRLGLAYEANVMALPGRPDVVFGGAKLVVFVDGDFWHGYRYPAWKRRLSPYWKAKIERNRRRDRLNHAKLRRRGWKVIRLWAHDVNEDLYGAINRILLHLRRPTACSTRPMSRYRQGSIAEAINPATCTPTA
jgi:DNA mismatch endonuclease (patch repair protein)